MRYFEQAGDTGGAGAAAAAAPAAGAAAAAAAPAAGAAPAFVATDAVKFLGDHGVDPKSLEGVAEPELKTRYESAKTIADKAAARALEAAKPKPIEKYEPFKAPQGVELDPDFSKEFEPVAKELGLDQGKAQKVYDLGGKLAQRFVAKAQKDLETTAAGWAAQVKADPELAAPEAQAAARIAMEKVATPEFKSFLDKSKLGNHPEMMRIFFRVAKLTGADKLITDGRPAVEDGGMANRLYGKTTPTKSA